MKIFFSLLTMMLVTSINAQPLFKCQQENGRFLFSDKPCEKENNFDNTLTNTYGVSSKLASTEKPVILSADLVDQIFLRIEHACQARDGNGLFDLFSKEAQESILKYRLNSQNLFDQLAYLCNTMVNIRADFEKHDEPILYASKKPQRDILLCFYTAKEGISNCTGNIKITAENKQLKLVDM